MSHIVEAKTTIENPDIALLRQAAELVAQQHSGGRVADHYLTYYGDRKSTTLAIFTRTMHRGIGIIVKSNGELVFEGDPFMVEEQFEGIQQQLVQTYVSLATMQALQMMGYQTTVEEGQEGQLILTGVNQYA
jgi:hypothetical protein